MSSLYKNFKTDENLEKTGIFLEYGMASNGEPIRIKICRSGGGNIAFGKSLDAQFKPYRRALQMDTLDNGVAERLLKKVFVDTVILGWENVEDENGEMLSFTKENVLKILDDLPELWNDIREQSAKAVLFREELRSNDAKN